MNKSNRFKIGKYQTTSPLRTLGNYDFMIFPFFNQNAQRTGNIEDFCKEALIKSDFDFPSDQHNCLAVQLSHWLLESYDKKNLKCLIQEVEFASYIGINAVIIKLVQNNITNTIQFIQTITENNHIGSCNIWIEIEFEQWELYNQVRFALKKMFLPIYLKVNQPIKNKNFARRWLAENLQSISISNSLFDFAKEQFEQSIQEFLFSAFQIDAAICYNSDNNKQQHQEIQKAVELIYDSLPKLNELESIVQHYFDKVEEPLQPYKDNLESITYQAFEKDVIKYQTYQQAIHQALKDKYKGNKVSVLLCGAGRGPLINCTLESAKQLKIEIDFFAVEKNPYAYLSLIQQKQTKKWNVTLVNTDIKDWDYQGQFDILFSELLGSFSDNELSPECLEWALKFLKNDGICIPQQYVSYLTPVSTPKVTQTLQKVSKQLEQMHVVLLHQHFIMDSKQIVECFEFKHPETNNLNQEKSISFNCKINCIINGFAGYFQTKLYKDVQIGIHPILGTKGSYSWFPMFIPLKESLNIEAKDIINLKMNRFNNGQKVWYEWQATQIRNNEIITNSITHNKNGASWSIYLL